MAVELCVAGGGGRINGEWDRGSTSSSGGTRISQRGCQLCRGYQAIIWQIFPENYMKMKKLWAGGGCPSRPLEIRHYLPTL